MICVICAGNAHGAWAVLLVNDGSAQVCELRLVLVAWLLERAEQLGQGGESVIRAAMSSPRARISAPTCRECAAKHSSPIGERIVQAQCRTATALSAGLCRTGRFRGSPAVPLARRPWNAPVMARQVRVSAGCLSHRFVRQ